MLSSSPVNLGNRFVQLAIAAALLITVAWFLTPSSLHLAQHLHVPVLSQSQPVHPPEDNASKTRPVSTPVNTYQPRLNHPIDYLIQQANEDFAKLISNDAKSLQHATQAYKERRGRHPPPGFDLWYHYAKNQSALVIESFFDRIYDDINPFWGVSAKQIREQANDFLHRISVRNGNVSKRSDEEDRPWMNLWSDMVGSVAMYLPDVDLPINVMDESRIVVPWEEINGYMEKERTSRKISDTGELKTTFQDLSDLDKHPPGPFDPGFDQNYPYWPQTVIGCPPDSPARNTYIDINFSEAPPLTGQYPAQSYHGYVKNWTFATSPCDHPALQGLHGTFVEPISLSNSKTFFPLFGGSKLPMNNEILLPPAMYWTDDPFYSGGLDHGAEWAAKNNLLVWRGAASGGRNNEGNWKRFQRHRFVAMVNATSVKFAEIGSEEKTPNFVLPANNTYDLAARGSGSQTTDLGDWISTWSDAAVVNLLCWPPDDPPSRGCRYTDQYFTVADVLSMKDQYADKYLPDIDGNSFSGRYRGFLGSTSMPIKATIYREWHDSRLVPWKHFVPMDNTFIDIYGIMEYFIGNEKMAVGGHDKEAESIALAGKEWTEKVLRKEDMSVYVFRLLLEYARLCDDDRDSMGWKDETVQ